MLDELKMTWGLLRSEPIPAPRPFAVTERTGYLWGVFKGSALIHLSLTHRGAEQWRYKCMHMYYDQNGWDKYPIGG